MTDIRPKLADGSRWEGGKVVDDCNVALAVDSTGDAATLDVGFEGDGSLTCSLYPADVLAVIRAAGFDKVWTAAVALADIYRLKMDPGTFLSVTPKMINDRFTDLRKAVEESSE